MAQSRGVHLKLACRFNAADMIVVDGNSPSDILASQHFQPCEGNFARATLQVGMPVTDS